MISSKDDLLQNNAGQTSASAIDSLDECKSGSAGRKMSSIYVGWALDVISYILGYTLSDPSQSAEDR